MKRREVTVGLLAGLASAAALAVASRTRVLAGGKPVNDEAAVAARRQLVGEWKLNPELSEDPREKMRQARGEGGRPEGAARPAAGAVAEAAMAWAGVAEAAATAATEAAATAATAATATARAGLTARARDA